MRRMNDRDGIEVSYDSLENLPEGVTTKYGDYQVDYEVSEASGNKKDGSQGDLDYWLWKMTEDGVNPIGKHAERKATPVFTGVLKYFPKAIKYVSQVSKAGNDQHHPDKPLHWDKSKSTDEPDALVRHLIDHSINPMDDDGMLHAGKVAWRALALLERYLDENPQ